MKCKSCAVETKVVDSRRKMDGVWRRRECAACKRRFNTMESVESEQPVVHKPKVVTPKVSKLRVVKTKPKRQQIVVDRSKGARRILEALSEEAATDELGWS